MTDYVLSACPTEYSMANEKHSEYVEYDVRFESLLGL